MPASAPAEAVPSESAATGPPLRLSGIATREGADGVQYTAIVSDGSGLHFVASGDELPGGLRVVDVQESAVTVRDATGLERTIRLP